MATTGVCAGDKGGYQFTVDTVTFVEVNGLGLWQEVNAQNPPVSGGGVAFGAGLDLEGSVALVGEPGDWAAGPFGAGTVHVYERGPVQWSEVGTILAPSPVADEFFGSSISIDGTFASWIQVAAALRSTSFFTMNERIELPGLWFTFIC